MCDDAAIEEGEEEGKKNVKKGSSEKPLEVSLELQCSKCGLILRHRISGAVDIPDIHEGCGGNFLPMNHPPICPYYRRMKSLLEKMCKNCGHNHAQ